MWQTGLKNNVFEDFIPLFFVNDRDFRAYSTAKKYCCMRDPCDICNVYICFCRQFYLLSNANNSKILFLNITLL